MESPYEYYAGKLGVRISFLLTDKGHHQDSIKAVCYRTLSYRMKSPTCDEIQLRKPSKKHPALVVFSSIETTWRKQLIERFGDAPANAARKNYFAQQFKFDTAAYNYFSRDFHRYEETERLTQDEVDEYTFNASVLNTVKIVKANRIEFRQLLNSSRAHIWDALSIEVNSFEEVNHTLPKTSGGLRNKFTEYQKSGYKSLVSGRRNNQNARKVDQDVIKLLNDLFAGQSHKPTAADVSRAYDAFIDGEIEIANIETGECYDNELYEPLTSRTISAYLAQWENRIGNYQLRGSDRQKLMSQFNPAHRLRTPQFASSLLSIDDRQPPFMYAPGKRAWFYIGIDLASGCITTAVHGKSKEGIIIDFYRQLVRNYTEWGLPLPDGLECESSLNSSFKNTFLQEGAMFQNVRIIANSARTKKIERFFNTFRNRRERSAEGWIGRPFAKAEANQAIPGDKVIIQYDRLIADRMQDIIDWNNEPHHEQKHITRWEYFMQNQHPNLMPTNWPAILPHLGMKTETSCRTGYIQLQEQTFVIAEDGNILSGEALIAVMKRIEGKNITVYWINNHKGDVLKAIAYRGNEYICELRLLELYQRAKIEQTDRDDEIRKLQSKYAATVNAFGKSQVKKVDKVVILNRKSATLNNNFSFPGHIQSQAAQPEGLPTAAPIANIKSKSNKPVMPAKTGSEAWMNSFL